MLYMDLTSSEREELCTLANICNVGICSSPAVVRCGWCEEPICKDHGAPETICSDRQGPICPECREDHAEQCPCHENFTF